MKKVLIAFFSRTGNTQKMAEFIAEGVRFTGNQAELKKITEIKTEKDLEGYDAYVFGCPTYHKTMTENFKTFLFLAERANLNGKIGGAFGSSTHSGEAPQIIFDTMEFVFKMKMTNLNALSLRENILASSDGMRACQDYGKAIGNMLNE